MTKYVKIALIAATGYLLPLLSSAQSPGGTPDNLKSMQEVLDQLYSQMIPLCSELIGVGRGIAGFGATWYIAARVWRHLASAEPIDFYPLLRPFAIGMVVLLFPSVIALINGVMQPTVTGTAGMVQSSNGAIALLLQQKEAAIKQTDAWQMYVGGDGSGDRDKWYQYTHPDDPTAADEGMIEGVGNDIKFAMAKASYNFRNSIKQWMSEVLEILFQAAALCINTIRTFYLIVLAILGSLVFGLAVFDGFQHTLTVWLARYINVFLWLPIANIFGSIIGKIQQLMLQLDISQIGNNGDTFFSSTDTAYLVFMIIGIVGYFTVPSVANYIVNAGGGSTLLYKVTSLFGSSTSSVVNTVTGTSGMVADAFGNKAERMQQSMSGFAANSGYFKDGNNGNHNHQHDKLSGKA
ncbi:MAG: conjugative transposon protein TraJ [Bacteroidota bacterium]|nr:conjugative transposon protein TraJ [Bacteroidota bacterium]